MKMMHQLYRFERDNNRNLTAFFRKDQCVATDSLNCAKAWHDKRMNIGRDFQLIKDDHDFPTMDISYDKSDMCAHSDIYLLASQHGLKLLELKK